MGPQRHIYISEAFNLQKELGGSVYPEAEVWGRGRIAQNAEAKAKVAGGMADAVGNGRCNMSRGSTFFLFTCRSVYHASTSYSSSDIRPASHA